MKDGWVYIDFGNGVTAKMHESQARALGLWPPAQDPVIRHADEGKMRPQVQNKMLPQAANKGAK